MTRGRLITTAGAAICLLAALLILGPSAAQTHDGEKPGGPPPGHMGPPPGGPPPMGMSPELQETLQVYLVFRLTEELELTDEQSLQLMPLIKKRERARWEHHQRRTDLQNELSSLLEDDEKSDAEIANAITALRELEKGFQRSEAQLDLEIAALLSTRQFARFVLFQQQFHNEIRQRIHRLRGMGHKGGRHGGRQ
jgi:hypothetical protein